MATGCEVSSFWDIAITRLEARRTTMHPFGMYLAITDSQRQHGWVAADARRAGFARVDATPLLEPEPVSRIGRLVTIVRRRVSRTANA